jgi:hypothetical protein
MHRHLDLLLAHRVRIIGEHEAARGAIAALMKLIQTGGVVP